MMDVYLKEKFQQQKEMRYIFQTYFLMPEKISIDTWKL